MPQGEVEHRRDVLLVAGGHDHHVGEDPHVRDVVAAVVRRPVGPDEPAAVEREDDRQVLQRDLLEDLVERALEERAVDVDDRPGAGLGHPGGEGDGVALADARVEEPRGVGVADLLELVPLAHRGRHHHDLRVALHGGEEGGADGVGVRLAGGRLQRDDPVLDPLEGGGGVVLDRVLDGRLEPVPLAGQDVEQDRPVQRLDLLQVAAQGLQVVAVDRPDVGEAHLLEEHPAVQRRLQRVLHLLEPAVGLVADQRDRRQELADPLVPVVVHRRHPGLVEVVGQAADGRADRHLVVVEDDQELLAEPGGVVQRLEDDPRGEGPVADDGDRVPVGPAHQLVARLQAQGRRGRAAGVAGHEQVVAALRRVGVAHQAPLGPDRVQLGGAAGDQLVRVDLVAGVPDQAVLGEVERQVQGQAELDDAEVAGEVRRAAADDADELVAHLPGELLEVRLGERLEVGGRPDPGQQRAAHQ